VPSSKVIAYSHIWSNVGYVPVPAQRYSLLSGKNECRLYLGSQHKSTAVECRFSAALSVQHRSARAHACPL